MKPTQQQPDKTTEGQKIGNLGGDKPGNKGDQGDKGKQGDTGKTGKQGEAGKDE